MTLHKCHICNQEHEIQAFHTDRPAHYWDVPENKRAEDVHLTSDSCVIANRFFFIHGLIEIPIIGTDEHFTWGVWVSLKEENFFIWQDNFETDKRCHIGPFFGWLSTTISIYPDTINLKTMAHLRDHGIRPRIDLELTDHPLSIEQHHGITLDRAMEITHRMLNQE